MGQFVLGEEMLFRSCFDSFLVILAFVIDDVEDFLPFLDLLFHFFLAAEEKVEAFLKRAVAFVDPFGELADFLDGKPCTLEALDNLERGEVDVREAAVSGLGPFEEGEKAGYRTKRVGKNLYYACIKGRIRGILKYARAAL